MKLLVTLVEAKERLRVTHDEEDGDITALIASASAAVMNYLKVDSDYYDDSSGEIPEDSSGTLVPDVVKVATLYLVGMLSRDRDGTYSGDWERGYLPDPVTSLLFPLRDPTVG